MPPKNPQHVEKPQFTIPANTYQGREWAPIIERPWDMAHNMTMDLTGIGQNGLVVIPSVAGPVGTKIFIAVSAQPHTLTNPMHQRIKSIGEVGDFTHNAELEVDGGIGAVVVEEGETPPRGWIGIVTGKPFNINIANAPGMIAGTTGDFRVTCNRTLPR